MEMGQKLYQKQELYIKEQMEQFLKMLCLPDRKNYFCLNIHFQVRVKEHILYFNLCM